MSEISIFHNWNHTFIFYSWWCSSLFRCDSEVNGQVIARDFGLLFYKRVGSGHIPAQIYQGSPWVNSSYVSCTVHCTAAQIAVLGCCCRVLDACLLKMTHSDRPCIAVLGCCWGVLGVCPPQNNIPTACLVWGIIYIHSTELSTLGWILSIHHISSPILWEFKILVLVLLCTAVSATRMLVGMVQIYQLHRAASAVLIKCCELAIKLQCLSVQQCMCLVLAINEIWVPTSLLNGDKQDPLYVQPFRWGNLQL